VGCYIWYSEEGPGRAAAPPSPLLAVQNVTAHPSTASVPITALLYHGPLLLMRIRYYLQPRKYLVYAPTVRGHLVCPSVLPAVCPFLPYLKNEKLQKVEILYVHVSNDKCNDRPFHFEVKGSKVKLS